ncbi:MAG: hypothetical protein NZ805_04425 [Armatimonadetes bacterium]|nr:hypothetical protein [Armatimonadota bacterium]MDW8027953.1 hypothetical protein [Armatimonadota bacterium]
MAKEVERIVVHQIDWDEFVEKAKAVYEQLKPQLLPQCKGMVIAIEPETGDYELGKTTMEAGGKLRQRHPGKIFFFTRVGYRTLGRL